VVVAWVAVSVSFVVVEWAAAWAVSVNSAVWAAHRSMCECWVPNVDAKDAGCVPVRNAFGTLRPQDLDRFSSDLKGT
jgi:hypothetical protein